jgi:hypothetical protein
MLPIVEVGRSCAKAERRLRMRSTLRHMRALSASCVEIGGAPGVVASALSCARPAAEMRRRTGISGEVASKGWVGACSSGGAFAGGVVFHLYAGWCYMLNAISLVMLRITLRS